MGDCSNSPCLNCKVDPSTFDVEALGLGLLGVVVIEAEILKLAFVKLYYMNETQLRT